MRRMTAAERGTAYHRAMQLLDFAALKGMEGRKLAETVKIQLDAFAQRRLMSEVQREAVKPSMLAKFLSAPQGLADRVSEALRHIRDHRRR